MSTIGRLLVNLGIDSSDYDSGLDNATKKASGFGGVLSGALGLAATAGAAAIGAVVGLGTASLATFSNFQSGMTEVFTLLPNMSQTAMSQMTEQVKDFAMEFGVLPDKVVPALYESISAGIPADNVFAFLQTAQAAAVGGVTELKTTVDGISSVMNAYGADVISATQASDMMFTAVNLGKTTFEQLATSLYNVTPTAAAIGLSFNNVSAALASMTATGVPTAVATTQLRQLMLELSDSTGVVGKAFQKVSGESFKEFIAGGGNLSQALNLLDGAAKGSGKGINELFGSVEAGGAALALTGPGAERFASAIDAMANSAGATDKAYKTMNTTLAASMGKIQAAGAVFLTNIGTKMAPSVEKLASSFVTLLQSRGATQFIDSVGTAMARAVDFVIAFGGAMAKLAGLAKGWGKNIGSSFADGIMAAAQDLVGSLQEMGNIIATYLKPGSPPKITPDLEKWGTEAANIYIGGWSKASFDAFNDLGSAIESSLQGLVDIGQFSQEGVIPTMLAGRAGLGQMFDELQRVGDVSEETFNSVIASMGPVGGKVSGLVRAYIDLAKATRDVQQSQQELNDTTARYDAILTPLNANMQALKDREKEIRDNERLAKLHETLADESATESEKELARNEIAQIELERQISGVEKERDAAMEAAQAKLDAATAAQTAAQTQVDAQQRQIDSTNQTNTLIGQQLQLLEQLASASAAAGAGIGGGKKDDDVSAFGGTAGDGVAKTREEAQAMHDAAKAAYDLANAFGFSSNAIALAADNNQRKLDEMDAKFIESAIIVETQNTAVSASIFAAIPRLVQGFAAWGVATYQWILDSMPKMMAQLLNLYGTVYGWIAKSAPGILASLFQWGLQFVLFVIAAIPKMVVKLGELLAQLITWIIQNRQKIYDQLATWGEQFKEWIVKKAIPQLVVGLADLWKDFLGWILETKNKLTADGSIGKALVDGIKDGISKAWGKFMSWIQDRINELPESVRTALGMASPSTIGIDIGDNFVTSIKIGWLSAFPALLATVGDKTKELASSVLNGVAGIARGIYDIFKGIKALEIVPDFQPLSDATKTAETAQKKYDDITKKLMEVNAEITRMGDFQAGDTDDERKHNADLLKLLEEQAKLRDDQNLSQQEATDAAMRQSEAQAAANQRAKTIQEIADRAAASYLELEQAVNNLMTSDPKAALELFNKRRAQIQELAELEKERALATTDAERASLDTQIRLLQAAQAAEFQSTTAQIAISNLGENMTPQQIIDIVAQALRAAGISVDLQIRTA